MNSLLLCTVYLCAADFMEYIEFCEKGDLLLEGWAKSEINCSFLRSISSPCHFLSRLFQSLCFCVVAVVLRICAKYFRTFVEDRTPSAVKPR